jgi:UDP-N-acetylmuramyl pentapeptide phosphotransferase/UDP-N-acetylglucosamine-1-phosphate transferase
MDDVFAFNAKCIAYSGIVVAAYLYAPTRDQVDVRYAVPILAMGSYIGLAWYDHFFDCNEKMRPGALISVVSGPFKPALGSSGRYGGF